VVEDAACAAGARADGGAVGRPHGDVACFSFHPRKIITTGEGGMVTTSDAETAARIRRLRQHGFDENGEAREPGYNLRMSEVAAAIGRVQLDRLPALLHARSRAAALYRVGLSGLPWLRLPPVDEAHTYQSYVVRVREDGPVTRDALIAHLARRGIGCQAGVLPVHHHAAYRGCERVPLPVAEEAGRTALFLPMHAGLAEEDAQYVCNALRSSSS
jgi:perosamine synthetase